MSVAEPHETSTDWKYPDSVNGFPARRETIAIYIRNAGFAEDDHRQNLSGIINISADHSAPRMPVIFDRRRVQVAVPLVREEVYVAHRVQTLEVDFGLNRATW